jgi:hypothetical protein
MVAWKGYMLLLKAVATALVLIAGAAVVLWYANTLNSWVLGGLIGGLAALLLSIPISLMLFSYLSHRHDGRSRRSDDAYDEAEPLLDDYDEVPRRLMKRISIEADNEYPGLRRGVWGEEYEEYEDDEQHYLPAPSRQQLPAPRVVASDQQLVHRSPSTQRDVRQTRQLSQRDLEIESRNTTSRRPNNPGYPAEKTRGKFQSQALRIAREEAYRRSEKEEEISDLPLPRSRRPTSSLHTRKLDTDRNEKPVGSRGYRQSSEDMQDDQSAYPSVQQGNLQRGRRIVDANPSPNSPSRTYANAAENQAHQLDYEEDSDPGFFDQTYMTGDLKKPLLRRAPYMYDNDALKNELAQQVDPPVTRRSTRYLPIRRDEE